jgi:putative PIN family toxin of toxin-antitoxin system
MSLKIVLDTNVLISAFYKPLYGPSFSKDVYDYLVENETVYVSAYILKEFRTKCLRKLKFKPKDVSSFERLIKKKVHLSNPMIKHTRLTKEVTLRDPKDRPILELSVFIAADLLITWDKDLLTLKRINKTKILSPREFWDSLI